MYWKLLIIPAIRRSLPTVRRINCRNATTTSIGQVLPDPPRTRFGVLKLVLMIIPGVTVGATLAETWATMLEELEIFIPEDDDDD